MNGITHDTIFTELGLALHAWNNIETALSEYFMALHGVGWHEISHPTRAAFEGEKSFQVRICKIRSSIKIDSTIPPEYGKPFRSLLNKLRQQYKKRNELAHFKMAVDWKKSPPEAVIMPFYKMAKHMSHSQEKLSVSDVTSYRENFLALNLRLNLHADYICRIKGLPAQWAFLGDDLQAAIQAKSD